MLLKWCWNSDNWMIDDNWYWSPRCNNIMSQVTSFSGPPLSRLYLARPAWQQQLWTGAGWVRAELTPAPVSYKLWGGLTTARRPRHTLHVTHCSRWSCGHRLKSWTLGDQREKQVRPERWESSDHHPIERSDWNINARSGGETKPKPSKCGANTLTEDRINKWNSWRLTSDIIEIRERGGGGEVIWPPIVIKMQPFCQNSQLSRSLESELENAVKTGELKLSAKNLRDFPKHGDRYNLQDTILAGNYNAHHLDDMMSVSVCINMRRSRYSNGWYLALNMNMNVWLLTSKYLFFTSIARVNTLNAP